MNSSNHEVDYEIIDNFLDQKTFDEIKNVLISHAFPWYYCPYVAYQNPDKDPYFFFCHTFFYDNKINSEYYELITPILDKLNIVKLVRSKANLYTNVFHDARNGNHKDFEYRHKGALFYINNNNGNTILNDNIEIESVENRILLFDPSVNHCSTHPTNSKVRINVVVNYV